MAGKYRTIVADPPWVMGTNRGWGSRRALPYDSMSCEEIGALPVPNLIEQEGYLFLWTTDRFLEDSFEIVRGWNLCRKQTVTWCKPPRGQGQGGLFAPTTEFVIVAQRVGPSGKSHRRNSTGHRIDRSHFEWPRGKHSEKPDAFLDLVEQVALPPRLEMFARRARFGWDYWGDESLGTAELPTPQLAAASTDSRQGEG
jgi:N6-adenosine-specific RNA methylase IME4